MARQLPLSALRDAWVTRYDLAFAPGERLAGTRHMPGPSFQRRW